MHTPNTVAFGKHWLRAFPAFAILMLADSSATTTADEPSLLATSSALRRHEITAALPQAVIDIGKFPLCERCSLSPKQFMLLGDASGPGMISSGSMRVVTGSAPLIYAAYAPSNSEILLFSAAGKFLRSIGRQGHGPGEIARLQDVQFMGQAVGVMDRGNGKLVVHRLDGSVVSERKLPGAPGHFRAISDTSVVIGVMDRSPALVGFPLHLWSLPSAQISRHFGSVDGQFSATEPFSDMVVLGWNATESCVWRGRPARLLLEEWCVDGKLRRTVHGEVEWFPYQGILPTNSPPRPTLLSFGVDADDRLWTLVNVPDARWRDVPTVGEERVILAKDLDGYYDTRIDVFDLKWRRHLGSIRWDERNVGLVQVGKQLMLQKVTYNENLVPQIALYRVEFPSQPSRQE